QACSEERRHQLLAGARRQDHADRIAHALLQRGVTNHTPLWYRQEGPAYWIHVLTKRHYGSSPEFAGVGRGNGMQILMIGSQKKTRFSRIKKMFRTKKAQIVISGILNPQIQLSWSPPEAGPADPELSPERLVFWTAFNSAPGTAKKQFGFAFLRKLGSVGSGRGTGGCMRPADSCQAA